MKKLALVLILCSPLINYAQVSQQSAQNKAVVCTACHGQNGISPQPIWPNIAGQNTQYFIKQMKDIKENKHRIAPVMKPIVDNLNDQDINDLAVYYAKMPNASGTTPEKFLKRGEELYRGGDFDKHIAACIACHGPRGTGNAQAGFPVLSGQKAQYTILQMQAFKEGKRSNDLNQIMRDISSRMSQEDMEAVAHYIEGLH